MPETHQTGTTRRQQMHLLAANVMLILIFGVIFVLRMNYEFIIYVGVILGFMALVAISIRQVDDTLATLVGLTVWSAMHLTGGGLVVGEGRLYDVMLISLSERYPIFRYDQIVHIWGFGVCTLVAYSLLAKHLPADAGRSKALGIVLVMAGLGMGALNEILEFAVTLAVPESGVGGYINTSLDLCADLIGALIGALIGLAYVRWRYIPSTTAGAN